MKISTFAINKIPDLSLNKYQILADTGIQGVLKRHESFLRQWHGGCSESESSFHLLFLYMPDEPIGERLKVYFIVQSQSLDPEIVKLLLKNSPLSDFFDFQETSLPNRRFQAGTTLTKKERIAEIFNPIIGESRKIHYVPEWKMNENSRLYDLFRMMGAIGQMGSTHSCAFRVDMYPVSLGMETRVKFDEVLKNLRGENDIKLMRESGSVRSDNYAKDICKEYEKWLTSIETAPHFRTNIYSFGGNLFEAKLLLNAAGAEALAEGDFSIAAIKAEKDGYYNILSRMDSKPRDYSFYPELAVLREWSTMYCLTEAASFFRFPVLYDGEVIEIPKETAPQHVDSGIYIGMDRNNYPIYIPLKEFSKHAFFTGMPGSGKTNSLFHLISEFRKKQISFLVLEPAKKEYRTLLTCKDMRDVYLFSPHLKSKFPLQMNPLEFPHGVQVSEHINALLEVFEGSFLLEGPTHKFLSNAIQKAYENKGWDIEDANDENIIREFPTLQDVYDILKIEIEKTSYDVDLKGNIRAFLEVRLGSLMERDAGELFNIPYSTFMPEEWIKNSAVVELEVLGEQAKNFFVLLISHYIVETLRVDPQGGLDSKGNQLPVRHVMFIEEAHNILAPLAQQQGDSVNPKISATAYIVKMLAEVRALRESIIIADQLPTALAIEVTKNTGIKMIHRLTAKDDKELIGSAVSASSIQLERIGAFSSGEALLHYEKILKPFEVQVNEWKKPTITYNVSNDQELYQEVKNTNEMKNIIEGFIVNWKYKYDVELSKEVNYYIKQSEKTNVEDAKQLLRLKIQKRGLIQKCNRGLKKCDSMEKQWKLVDVERKLYEEVEKTRQEILKNVMMLNK